MSFSLLSLLFRSRHHQTDSVPATRLVQCRRPSSAFQRQYFYFVLPALIVVYFSLSHLFHQNQRGKWQHSGRPPQLSHQSALCSPNLQCFLPSSSSPCRCSHSPVTPTTMTQPDVPLSRISLAVARYGPQQCTHQHPYWRRDHEQW